MLLALIQGFASDAAVVRTACSIARQEKEKLTLLYVIEIDRKYPVDREVEGETDRAEEALQEMEKLSKKYKVKAIGQILQARSKGSAVLSQVDELKANCIIMGAQSDPRVELMDFGKTARHILNQTQCALIVCQGSRQSV